MKKVADSYNLIFKAKKRILAVFAHPDDLELFAGGTIARLIADNKRVRAVKVTSGEMGCRQDEISSEKLRKIREREDKRAMRTLGIESKDNIYLRVPDGSVENSMKTIGLISEQIRIFKPDLIITHNPEDAIIRFDKDTNWVNHRDHRNTGISTIDASFPYSRDLLFFPEHFKNKEVSSHEVIELLLVDYYDHPELVHIDVTQNIKLRVKAHAKHSSQYSVKDAQESADFFTKLSSHPKGKRYERFRYLVVD